MEDRTVSVIVPSFNGAERLPKLLDALDRQTYRNFETVVVLDGSTDDSKGVLNARDTSYPIHIVEQANAGRAAARNAGVKTSVGKILVFYDDDMQPESDSIERHLALLRSSQSSISAGQQIEVPLKHNEFTQYKTYLTQKWVSHLSDRPQKLGDENLFLTAANMAMRREDFDKLGGFDAELKDAEDFDLAVRAREFDIGVVFDPRNMARHQSFGSFREYILRRRQYMTAHARLRVQRRDHPYRNIYNRYQVDSRGYKRFFYALFPVGLVAMMDRGFFNRLPKRAKYALYSRIIAAFTVYRNGIRI